MANRISQIYFRQPKEKSFLGYLLHSSSTRADKGNPDATCSLFVAGIEQLSQHPTNILFRVSVFSCHPLLECDYSTTAPNKQGNPESDVVIHIMLPCPLFSEIKTNKARALIKLLLGFSCNPFHHALPSSIEVLVFRQVERLRVSNASQTR